MMMAILPATACALLLGDRLPILSSQSGICRRPLVVGASTLLLGGPQAAQAGDFSFDPSGSWVREKPDGSWTDHDGPFDDAFFKDFKTTETGFVYKFVADGDGDKPVQGQSVLMHYTGYLLNGKVCALNYFLRSAPSCHLGTHGSCPITAHSSPMYAVEIR